MAVGETAGVAEKRTEPDFTTAPDLQRAFTALLAREPLFHHRDLVATPADFDRETATDFWEGRRVRAPLQPGNGQGGAGRSSPDRDGG
jgi:hypothetical protein